MNNRQNLKELAARAKRRLEAMSTLKTAEDTSVENQDFAFLEPQIYKEIVQGDSKCS